MYPSYREPALIIGASYKLIRALSACVVLVRPMDMDSAYPTLCAFLQQLYTAGDSAWSMPRAHATEGASVVVYKNGGVYRGVIVHIDDDGCVFEVALIDIGEQDFYELGDLRVPHPLAAVMPALAIECSVYGLHTQYIDGGEEILEAVGQRSFFFIDSVERADNQLPLVRFSTEAYEDIAALVIGLQPEEEDEGVYLEIAVPEEEGEGVAEEGEEEEEDPRSLLFNQARDAGSSDDDEELDETVKDLFITDSVERE